MAKKQVLMISCDNCGKDSANTQDFFHVTVQTIAPLDDKKAKATTVSVKDLCKACVGAPGINVQA